MAPSVLSKFSTKGVFVIGEKVQHVQNKGTDLGELEAKIESNRNSEGCSVQTSSPGTQGLVLQAKKGGFLPGVVDVDRALSIVISGDASDYTVRIGIGKWLQTLGVAVLETLLLPDLFLVADVAESAWNIEIEDKLAKKTESSVEYWAGRSGALPKDVRRLLSHRPWPDPQAAATPPKSSRVPRAARRVVRPAPELLGQPTTDAGSPPGTVAADEALYVDHLFGAPPQLVLAGAEPVWSRRLEGRPVVVQDVIRAGLREVNGGSCKYFLCRCCQPDGLMAA
ncbi:MAG: hypothetical protein M0Z95_05480 [Actinomycetota bacterium]|nr:hypothetical protein [Actinomycetota bacterium]